MKLNPMRREDKMCRSKRAYVSIAEMQAHAAEAEVTLYAYQCPYGEHYHVTKHSRPIDPELKDRVNTLVSQP